MRIWVIGTSGVGKTTFAAQIAERLRIPRMEMDAVNWRPGWDDLNSANRSEFERQVAEFAAGGRWVCDGNYRMTAVLLPRVSDLVWLDYSRARIMYQVVTRSFARAASKRETWPGCRETWGMWLKDYHPVRWAWSTIGPHRPLFREITAQAEGGGECSSSERH